MLLYQERKKKNYIFYAVASVGAQASVFEDINSDKETKEDEKGPPVKVKKYDKNALCIKKLPEDMANGTSCQHVWNMNPSEYQPYIPFDEDYMNDTEGKVAARLCNVVSKS